MRSFLHRDAGLSLIETLLAMLVVALAALTLGRVAGDLRGSVELSRQRAVALRLLQAELESARAFVTLGGSGAGSWTAIGLLGAADTRNDGLDTYQLQRAISQPAGIGIHQLQLRANWTDRRGQTQVLELRSAIGALDPTWSSGLTLPAAGARSGDALGRSPLLALDLVPLADGRAAWQPYGATTGYFVLDVLTSRVRARCDGTMPAPGGNACGNNLEARLLLGHIAFHAAGEATLAGARDPAGAARPLAGMQLTLLSQGGATPTAECFDDSAEAAASGRSAAAYACVISVVDHDGDPATPGVWSGRGTVLPDATWSIGTMAGQSRVCRYSADHDGAGIDNVDHPLDYRDVKGVLPHQNYLVIDAVATVGGVTQDNLCPFDLGPAGTSATIANATTVPHQPVASP